MPQPFQRLLGLQATVGHFPAPIGGWNSYDSIANMAPTDAVSLINVFPETTLLRLRHGSQPYVSLTGVSAQVQSLMSLSRAQTQQMLAAAGGSIYNITSGQSTVATGFTSDQWQWTNMSTPGGQFLVAVNGTGQQWTYDGTTWAAAQNTWDTGAPETNTFSSVALFSQRLFFAGNETTNIYYLPVNVLSGVLSAFDAGAFLRKGGSIVGLANWTRDDATQGMQNMLVAVSSEGEFLVYQGTNPSDPTNWSMTGRFEIGKPVGGHRMLTRLGPDTMIICEDGFQALANYLALGESQALTTAISRKIGNAVTAAVKAGRTLFGWEACLYAANNALIVNVPQGGGNPVQYVVNTITGAWTQFTGLNAYTWLVFGDSIFFGSNNGTIWQGDVGGDDNGQPITFDIVTSFQLPNGVVAMKRALMARPYIQLTNGQYSPNMDVNVDYQISPVTSPIVGQTGGTNWNEFNWNQANWGGSGILIPQWYSVCGLGNAFALRINGVAQAEDFQLLAFDLAFESGLGIL